MKEKHKSLLGPFCRVFQQHFKKTVNKWKEKQAKKNDKQEKQMNF